MSGKRNDSNPSDEGGHQCNCNMCGYSWKSSADKQSNRCPSCRSTRWNNNNLSEYNCLRCGHSWVTHNNPKRCPGCGTEHWREKPVDYNCVKCGHSWKSRKAGLPKKCPACKSFLWNNKTVLGYCKTCKLECIVESSETKCPACNSSLRIKRNTEKNKVSKYKESDFSINNQESSFNHVSADTKTAEIFVLLLKGYSPVKIAMKTGCSLNFVMEEAKKKSALAPQINLGGGAFN